MTRPFDLVILDLDGTILDPYHARGVSPLVQATILAVQAAGVPVTIGTGRTLDYIREHFGRPLQLRVPVVSTQGAVIGDPVTGRVLVEKTIDLATAQRAAAWIEAAQEIAVFYFSDADGRVHLFQNTFASDPVDVAFHNHVFGAPRTLLPSFQAKLTGPAAHPPLKFIIDNDIRTVPDLVPTLQAHFGDDLYVTRTHQRLVEGTAPGVSKGTGVLELCRLLQIDPARVLAIGDNDNDIPMLEVVGYGVAMGNATAGAKSAARWIAPSIADDGAAVALQRLVLG